MHQHKGVVESIHDVQNGKMKQVDVNDMPVLLARMFVTLGAGPSIALLRFAKL